MASRCGATRPCWPATGDSGNATPDDAARFIAALAERLQVDPSLAQPAYEDIHYYLWREHRLPANVVAEDAKLRDEMERARLARVFGGGLASPVGSVLPLRRAVRDGVRVWQGGTVVLPRWRAVPGPRRFADRPAPAAGQPALGQPGGDRAGHGAGSVRAARAAAASAGVPAATPHSRGWPPGRKVSVLWRRTRR